MRTQNKRDFNKEIKMTILEFLFYILLFDCKLADILNSKFVCYLHISSAMVSAITAGIRYIL
jgi:hypothetical protein